MDQLPPSYSHLNAKERRAQHKHIRNHQNQRARRLLATQGGDNYNNINNNSYSNERNLTPVPPSPPSRVPLPSLPIPPPAPSESPRSQSNFPSPLLHQSPPGSPHTPFPRSPSPPTPESPPSTPLTYRIFSDIPQSSPLWSSYSPISSPLQEEEEEEEEQEEEPTPPLPLNLQEAYLHIFFLFLYDPKADLISLSFPDSPTFSSNPELPEFHHSPESPNLPSNSNSSVEFLKEQPRPLSFLSLHRASSLLENVPCLLPVPAGSPATSSSPMSFYFPKIMVSFLQALMS